MIFIVCLLCIANFSWPQKYTDEQKDVYKRQAIDKENTFKIQTEKQRDRPLRLVPLSVSYGRYSSVIDVYKRQV